MRSRLTTANCLDERKKIQCYGSEFTPVDEWENKYVSSYQALERGISFHIPLDSRHFSRKDSGATDEAYGSWKMSKITAQTKMYNYVQEPTSLLFY